MSTTPTPTGSDLTTPPQPWARAAEFLKESHALAEELDRALAHVVLLIERFRAVRRQLSDTAPGVDLVEDELRGSLSWRLMPFLVSSGLLARPHRRYWSALAALVAHADAVRPPAPAEAMPPAEAARP